MLDQDFFTLIRPTGHLLPTREKETARLYFTYGLNGYKKPLFYQAQLAVYLDDPKAAFLKLIEALQARQGFKPTLVFNNGQSLQASESMPLIH